MKKAYTIVGAISFWILTAAVPCFANPDQTVKLPGPILTSDTPIEKALAERRSIRSYKKEPLRLSDISQVLWAAQGVTDQSRGLRTAPSPRAAYLIKVYLVAADVTDLTPGLYRYEPKGHELTQIAAGERRSALYEVAGQGQIKNAPAVLVITGDMNKTENKYWPYLEAGHVSENIYLQCVSLKLGTVSMAGIKADQVKKALGLPEKDEVIYLMPLGKR